MSIRISENNGDKWITDFVEHSFEGFFVDNFFPEDVAF
jgi:hypothetical protein